MTATHVHHISADLTLSSRLIDELVIADGAADLVVKLPPSNSQTAGKRVTCVQRSLSTGTGFAIDPDDADVILGQTIAGVSIAGAAGKKLINTGATDVLGDRATLQADGNGAWYIVGLQGVWDAEA